MRPKKKTVLASLGGYDQRAARSQKMDFRIELGPVSSKRANTVYTPISVPHDVVIMRARMLASWDKKRRCSLPTKALAAIKDHCSCCLAGALRGKACRSCPASFACARAPHRKRSEFRKPQDCAGQEWGGGRWGLKEKMMRSTQNGMSSAPKS